MAQLKAKGRSVASRAAKSRKSKAETPNQKPDVAKRPDPTGLSGRTNAKKFEPTDVGNAERLIGRYGDDLRYCAGWGKWLIWDGKRWVPDRTQKIFWLAKETVLAMKSEAKVTDDDDERSKIRSDCRASQRAARLEAMCRVAEADRMVAITPEQLDQDPFLLNCKNGTLNLKTGEFRKHRRVDMLTKITPVEFSESATCPVFDAFLNRITGGDANLAGYLQRCVGYCLTGQVTEKAVFFLCGDGDNGKTTFVETIRHVLGEYGGQIPIESFLRKNNNGIPNDVAQLQGLRLVASSEVPEGRSLDESKVKYMTGMGTMQGRFLYHELFEFPPTFKLWIDTNRKPRVAGDEKALWNRVRVVPFNATIPDNEKDKKLLEKLKAEASGILAWAVRGCQEWLKNGLQEPEAVRKASQAYREEMDTVTRFIAECCELNDGNFERTADLYEAYSTWCTEEGEKGEEKPIFAKLLGRRSGLTPQKVDKKRGWNGIKLKKEHPVRHCLMD